MHFYSCYFTFSLVAIGEMLLFYIAFYGCAAFFFLLSLRRSGCDIMHLLSVKLSRLLVVYASITGNNKINGWRDRVL